MWTSLLAHLQRTATPFEWYWTFPALLAFLLRAVIFAIVFGDASFWRRETRAYPGHDVKAESVWAAGQMVQKIIVLLVLLIMTAFGLVALLSPPSIQPPPPPTRVTYMLTFTFISIPTLFVLDAAVYLISRKRTKDADDTRTANQRRRATDVPLPGVISAQLDAAGVTGKEDT
jgi:hypothetical protein